MKVYKILTVVWFVVLVACQISLAYCWYSKMIFWFLYFLVTLFFTSYELAKCFTDAYYIENEHDTIYMLLMIILFNIFSAIFIVVVSLSGNILYCYFFGG